MNENIDLIKILKNCPKGTKFYSSIYGDLYYESMYISSSASTIYFTDPSSRSIVSGEYLLIEYRRDGRIYPLKGECTLFPSKEQRDWSKFTASWFNNKNLIQNKFDPKNLIPFDKVLVRDSRLALDSLSSLWRCQIFSFIEEEDKDYLYVCIGESYRYCIPYNDDTKHLVGTNKEAPKYYRY